jgi:hypothetical protein
MKSTAQSSLYFSAYPLKAIPATAAAVNESPYLKAVLAGGNKITTRASRIRVYPMANPYPKISAMPLNRVSPVKDVESSDKEWFNHYE